MIDTQDYQLTLEHIRQFLATKEESDPLGHCYDALECLLSETLNWLYPQESPWRVDQGYYHCRTVSPQNLESTVNFLQRTFDSIPCEPVTKGDLRKYLEFLRSLNLMDIALFPFPSHPEREEKKG